MQIIFTDLDGALLDRDTHSWEAARPALEWVAQRRIPLIFVSGKTRAELEFWRRQTGNIHPYIVENGGALVIPKGYFDRGFPGEKTSRSVELIPMGVSYTYLVTELRRISRAARCPTQGFHDMTTRQVADQTSLSLEHAQLAKRREFDEPFVVLDERRREALIEEIERAGLSCSAGGRLLHLSGRSDQGMAVRELIRRYGSAWGPVRSLGIGYSLTDLSMLASVNVPVILRSPAADELTRRLPHATVTPMPGPEGWNQAVLSLAAA